MNIGPGSWTIRRAARVRLVAGIGAAVCVVLFLVTANRRVMVRSGEWLIGLSSGCLIAGSEIDYGSFGGGGIDQRLFASVRLVSYASWDAGYASAWRPFRAGNTKHSRLVVPIWPMMVGLACLAGVAHGVAVGRRRTRPGFCPSCGYDLRGLLRGAVKDAAAGGGTGGAGGAGGAAGRCPECGARMDVPAA